MRCVLAMDPLILADSAELQRQVAEVVELVARQNRYLMRKLGRRRIPRLYDSGVVYRVDPWDSQLQHFPDCVTVVRRRFADCKGLVPYRLAELREEHPDQHFAVHIYPRKAAGFGDGVATPTDLLHLQVRLPSGEIEDPSRLLHQ